MSRLIKASLSSSLESGILGAIASGFWIGVITLSIKTLKTLCSANTRMTCKGVMSKRSRRRSNRKRSCLFLTTPDKMDSSSWILKIGTKYSTICLQGSARVTKSLKKGGEQQIRGISENHQDYANQKMQVLNKKRDS